MSDIKIRHAKKSELAIIQDLNHELFKSDSERDEYLNHSWSYNDGEKYFKKRINSKNSICLVALVNRDIVGYLAGSIMNIESWRIVSRTELENIFVKEEYRNLGVGKALVREFLKWSKEKKVQKSLVIAYATNEKAIKFYQREGFVPESVSLEIKLN